MNQKKVLVAMSGGVDSAVCAYLIKDQGFVTEGMTLVLWSDTCRISNDENPIPDINCADARCTADQLNIPHHTLALGDSFRRHVIDPFVDDYCNGLTPNPCVRCNQYIKLGQMLHCALERGFDYLATGHYARIEKDSDGKYHLLRAIDQAKDQSYFLWAIPRESLSHILFPLGDYTKENARAIAEAQKLSCAKRSDSQDICFIPNGDYVSFIESYSERSFPCGEFISKDQTPLGRHDGIIRYTVGQRKGLGIAMGYPIFVGEKNALTNTVTLCRDEELYSDELTAKNVNLLETVDPTIPLRVDAKIRYRHTPAPATVIFLPDGRISVRFDQPQRAIAPGQSVVLYKDDTVVGGGIIE